MALARAVLAGSGAARPLLAAPCKAALRRRHWEAFAEAVRSRLDAAAWIDEVAADLKAHAGRGVIVAGRRQPPLVHALVHAMNAALGNIGKTVELRSGPATAGAGTLEELAEAIGKGQVETLVILGGNPAYDAPADLEFAALMKQVETTIRLGLHADETSREATWHLPAAHYLESWGDARDRRRDGRADPAADRAALRRADGARGGRPALRLTRRRRPTRSSAGRSGR